MLCNQAISKAPLISSNTLHRTLDAISGTLIPKDQGSFSSSIIGITSQRLLDTVTYSASMEERVVIVCSLYAHEIRHPAKHMIHPALDFDIMGSEGASFCHQAPAKSESTQHLKPFPLSGQRMSPSYWLLSRYFPIHIIALACDDLGHSENGRTDEHYMINPTWWIAQRNSVS